MNLTEFGNPFMELVKAKKERNRLRGALERLRKRVAHADISKATTDLELGSAILGQEIRREIDEALAGKDEE